MNTARLAVGFGVVVLAFVVVRLLLVEPVVVRQVSMEPTLVDGDTALVSKWCRWAGTWGRGDVVAVRSPVDGELLVKRIVATAGQRVGLRDGRLAVDGRAAPPDTDFEAIDGGSVQIVFGVVGPKRATGEHLRTLARISRLLRDGNTRARLLASESSAAAYELIQDHDARTEAKA